MWYYIVMEGENKSSGDKNQVQNFRNGFYAYTDSDGVRFEDEAYRKLSEQPGFGTAGMAEVKQIYFTGGGSGGNSNR